ncbi:MAG TPA: hypothetical protein VK634_09105 [Reyranella sp.]|nr:hypothetical protein [Reyranella sp.]
MFVAHDVEVELAGDNELLIVFRLLGKALAGRKGRARWLTKIVENNDSRPASRSRAHTILPRTKAAASRPEKNESFVSSRSAVPTVGMPKPNIQLKSS